LKPQLVFCLYPKEDCVFVEAINYSLRKSKIRRKYAEQDISSSVLVSIARFTPLAIRVLKAQCFREEGFWEIWARASGDPESMKLFTRSILRNNEIDTQLIYRNPFNTIFRMLVDCESNGRRCTWCPIRETVPGAYVKSTVILDSGILVEYIVAKSQILDNLVDKGCIIIKKHSIEEMDYMLTTRQEVALVYAYFRGYYEMPRRIGLKKLAHEIGVSVSSLAEMLRRAEAKVMEAFMRHELPHYMVLKVLSRKTRVEKPEAEIVQEPTKAEIKV